MTIADNVARVRARIAAAAERSGRLDEDVLLVAVSKTFPASLVSEALDAGVTDVGENRAQELRDKAAALGARARWHFVGHLQSNKVRHVVGVATVVHSVDRVALADEIARRARLLDGTQEVLIEVNVSGEDSKHGVSPDEALRLAEYVAGLEGLRLRGLMSIPPLPETPEQSRPHYRRLAQLGERVTGVVPEAGELSMGMTRDFEVAIEEGATIVRVGEAIFGSRT